MVNSTDRLSDRLCRPLTIGNRSVGNRLVMAPMTLLGHVAFRQLIAGFGGFGLLWTEMCNSKRVPAENRRLSQYFRWRDEELPYLVCQIVGNDPHQMAESARRIETEGFFGVDLNFGCSAGPICRQHGAAALLKQPATAAGIVSAVRRAVSIPVFVKFRTGWQDDPDAPADMGRRFADAGADALVFHPRVAPDRRTRPPRWEYIARVQEAVDVPVFGNGNVFDAADGLRMIQTTGCSGIALGRIAIAKPWIFSTMSAGYAPGPEIYPACARRLCRLLERHFEPAAALRRLKRFALYFAANFRFGLTLYNGIRASASIQDARRVFDRFFSLCPDVTMRPNMNFFS
jgi:nifR3 family TIM-barrel protein